MQPGNFLPKEQICFVNSSVVVNYFLTKSTTFDFMAINAQKIFSKRLSRANTSSLHCQSLSQGFHHHFDDVRSIRHSARFAFVVRTREIVCRFNWRRRRHSIPDYDYSFIFFSLFFSRHSIRCCSSALISGTLKGRRAHPRGVLQRPWLFHFSFDDYHGKEKKSIDTSPGPSLRIYDGQRAACLYSECVCFGKWRDTRIFFSLPFCCFSLAKEFSFQSVTGVRRWSSASCLTCVCEENERESV